MPKIKAEYKSNQKFKKTDIAQLKKIDLNELEKMLKTLSPIDFKAGLEFKFELNYDYSTQSMNGLKLVPTGIPTTNRILLTGYPASNFAG
jgi:hypothetical protein